MMFFVYILTNKLTIVLYTGVTNNLDRHLFEHINKTSLGFTAKYNLNKLVYFETFTNIVGAIEADSHRDPSAPPQDDNDVLKFDYESRSGFKKSGKNRGR